MSAADPIGAAPETHRARFLWLLFGCCAAPGFWIGQLVLGYAVTAYACYPGDSPLAAGPKPLFTLLMAFDAVAIAAALTGGVISVLTYLHSRDAGKGGNLLDQRTCFLALWGTMASLWFFFAILFNTIASVMAPICGE